MVFCQHECRYGTQDSKTYPAEQSSYVTLYDRADGSCCCLGSADNYKLLNAKAGTPMVLSSDVRLQIQRLLCNSAETATLQAAETTQKPESKKGGAKTVFPTLFSPPTPIISLTQ